MLPQTAILLEKIKTILFNNCKPIYYKTIPIFLTAIISNVILPSYSFGQADFRHGTIKAADNENCTLALKYNSLSEKFLLSNFDSSLYYSGLALEYSRKCGSPVIMAETLLNNGNALDLGGKYTEAFSSTSEALKIFRKNKDMAGAGKSLHRLGKISFHQSECSSEESRNEYYTESLKHYTDALKISEDLNDSLAIADNKIEIGRVLFSIGKPDSALVILTHVLKNCEKKSVEPGFLHNVAKSSFNIALIFIEKEKFPEAIKFLYKAATADSMLNNKEGVALIRIAEIYLKLGDIDKACSIARQSLDTAVKYKFNLRIYQANEVLYKAYALKGDYKEAFGSLLEYKQINDSLKNDKYIKEITKIKLENEFEIKRKQEELAHEAKLEKQRIITWSVGFALILLVAFLIYGIHSYRQKQIANILLSKQYAEIQQQKEEIETQRDEIEAQRDEISRQHQIVTIQKEKIETIHKEITDSITYARRIQRASLTPLGIIKETVSDYFLIYMPKDVVSGDFYWAAKVENQLILTVADCTGHGVPGAFMSMLGISLLKEIVIKEYITHPPLILKRMRKEVVAALQQSGFSDETASFQTSVRDGMDMAVVSIETTTMKLTFSGANNPLYLIRRLNEFNEIDFETDTPKITFNKFEDSVFVEFKGDKMPIAIYEKMESFTFTELELKKNDCLYMMSDGYHDQFGGPKNKKFGTKQLKEKLLTHAHEPMDIQGQRLGEVFDNWVSESGAGNSQIDDVTLMGIKI